jgi:Bacterial PH domain
VSDAVARPVPPAVVARPRRASVIAVVAAVVVLVLFVVAGVVLPASDTGVYFRSADQVAIVTIGLLLAGAVLLAARPRVRADTEGIEVRNLVGARRLPWTAVRRVTFPDGAPWARLDIGSDEYVPVLAIQAIDRQHAVNAIRAVRALHAAAAKE